MWYPDGKVIRWQRHGLWGIKGQVEEGPVEETKEARSEKQEQNKEGSEARRKGTEGLEA